jgi:hypothetical protein
MDLEAVSVTFTDLVWEDDDLFGDAWFNFSEPEENDFWSEAFDEDLLLLK